METYRWDKRRVKLQRRKLFTGVTVFDAILLFLIFCLGLFFFYAFLSMSFRISTCFEQIANYGATAITQSVFKALYFISLILFALWGALLITNMHCRPSWLRFLWDAITGLSLAIMCGLYFHLSVWSNPNSPDGTLGIGEGVWTTENGTPEWRKLPPEQIPLEQTGGAIEYFTDYRNQECVWLDDNNISITLSHSQTTENFDDYVKKLQEGGLRQGNAFINYPNKIKFREFIAAFFRPTSHLEGLISTQFTRPLTTEERARFIEKQACMQHTFDSSRPGNKIRTQIEEQCDPAQVPYWPPGYW